MEMQNCNQYNNQPREEDDEGMDECWDSDGKGDGWGWGGKQNNNEQFAAVVTFWMKENEEGRDGKGGDKHLYEDNKGEGQRRQPGHRDEHNIILVMDN